MVTSHFGKPYQSEPAVISLTSWKARISTVGLTLYSIFKNCPGFHVCLVLSEEEFPKKEAELPKDLILMCKIGLLEILWIIPNIKAMKKVLPTMTVYRDIPIISADDDCIYVCNYAKELYQKWCLNKGYPVNYRKSSYAYCTCGPATIYPPNLYSSLITEYISNDTDNQRDDGFFTKVFSKYKIQPTFISDKFPCYFHDEIHPINGSTKVPAWIKSQRFR